MELREGEIAMLSSFTKERILKKRRREGKGREGKRRAETWTNRQADIQNEKICRSKDPLASLSVSQLREDLTLFCPFRFCFFLVSFADGKEEKSIRENERKEKTRKKLRRKDSRGPSCPMTEVAGREGEKK